MSVNCPSCGAGIEETATTCAFCKSALSVVACPACLGAMFVGSRFCPHCGASAALAESTGEEPLPCPGCRGEMRAVRIGATAMHSCAGCGSAWLTPAVFESLCNDRQRHQPVVASLEEALGPGSATPFDKPRYVKCPRCEKIMNRVNFGRTSGVIVDVCKPHGILFERDELRRVLAFIAGGHLDHPAEHDGTTVTRFESTDGSRHGETTIIRRVESKVVIHTSADPGAPMQSALKALLESLFD